MTATLQNTETRSALTRDLKSEASRLGFDLVGVAPAVAPGGFPQFQQWLGSGYAGEMSYLPNREQAYAHPESVLECVRSVVMLAVNYNTASRERQHKLHQAG